MQHLVRRVLGFVSVLVLSGGGMVLVACEGGTAREKNEANGTGVDLSLKWQPGKTYHFEHSTVSKVKMPLPGQAVDTNSTMSMVMLNKTSEHEKGVKVGTEFAHIRMNTAMAGIQMEYDSEDPAKSGGLLGGILGPLAKAKFATIYDQKGKVVEMEGLDSIQAVSQMGLGKSELEAMTRQSAQFVPGRAVEIGETWESEVSLPMGPLGDDLMLLYSFKLEGVDENEGKEIARISITGKMKADTLEDGKEEVLTVEAKKISGEMLFDLELGQPSEIRTSLDLEMAPPAALPKAEGAPGKMPVQSESVQKLLKVE